MERSKDTGPVTGRARLHHDFIDGLKCFRGDDLEGALTLFRAADTHADADDIYQNRYTSFHGLCRVYLGDRKGITLCRKAAVAETGDVEVFYNLALGEHRLGQRESARAALRRGLLMEPDHRGLQRLGRELGLFREHPVNRYVGRLFRGLRRPGPR
jgi:hypothetical protein